MLTRGRGDRVELLLRRASQAAETPAGGVLGELPATFTGDLPCADCPGIRYQLDLFPDGAFYLRQTYLGRGPDAAFDLIGGFLIAADGRTLALHGDREAPLQFGIAAPDGLRQLDLEGRPIVSELNYDLIRAASFSPIEPHLELRGMYRYMADAGLFTECLTRRRLPVVMEAGNAALERAYLEARRQPGEELLVNLEGRIELRPKVEGAGQVPMLVPLRLIGVWPGETCGARFNTAPLVNTYWKLTRLRDQPVLLAEQQRSRTDPAATGAAARRLRRLQPGGRRLSGRGRDPDARPGREHDDGLSRRHGHRAGVPGRAGAGQDVQDRGRAPRGVRCRRGPARAVRAPADVVAPRLR